jgi:hypothetical protein
MLSRIENRIFTKVGEAEKKEWLQIIEQMNDCF